MHTFESLEDRCDAVEECYEFMLAYAAQGLNGNEGSASGGQLRHFLIRAVDAIKGLAEACQVVEPQVIAGPYLKVLERDASDSLASIKLVLAQPWISSQLIDNLNASMHLRALLTDLFLIGEVEKIRTQPAPPVLQVTDDTSSSQVGKSEMALGVNGTNGLIETIAPYND